MNKIHVYIDGTWLFKQCQREGILAKVTYDESKNFRLDFKKLISIIKDVLSNACNSDDLDVGGLWYYTSVIESIPAYDLSSGVSLEWLKLTSDAKLKTAINARNAGFDISGVFKVPFQNWMPKQIIEGTFQEKMVDTSLVARMVLSCVQYPDDFHVLVSGDLDMLPAVSLVVPEYLEKVVLFTTHPDQYDPNMQQTSRKLVDFSFSFGPYFLDDIAEKIMLGNHVYKCSNPSCVGLFSTNRPIPSRQRPFCRKCMANRPVRR